MRNKEFAGFSEWGSGRAVRGAQGESYEGSAPGVRGPSRLAPRDIAAPLHRAFGNGKRRADVRWHGPGFAVHCYVDGVRVNSFRVTLYSSAVRDAQDWADNV